MRPVGGGVASVLPMVAVNALGHGFGEADVVGAYTKTFAAAADLDVACWAAAD